MKILRVTTIEELIEELSMENDRIGDFEPIKWHITKENFIVETHAGKFIELVINKPVTTTNEQPKFTTKEYHTICNALEKAGYKGGFIFAKLNQLVEQG